MCEKVKIIILSIFGLFLFIFIRSLCIDEWVGGIQDMIDNGIYLIILL